MTKHIIKTESDWLDIRKKYITASNVACLVGADPYSSPSSLRNPAPFTGNSFTRVGQMLEPVVVNVLNDVMGTRFELYENPEGHKEFYTEGRLGATPDAHEDRKRLLECKTTRPHTYLKYGAIPPAKYVLQLMVQLMCTGMTEGYLAIMSTNLTQRTSELIWPISIFKVLYCPKICSILKVEAERFTLAVEEDKTFRVNSDVKKRIQLLISMCYTRIH